MCWCLCGACSNCMGLSILDTCIHDCSYSHACKHAISVTVATNAANLQLCVLKQSSRSYKPGSQYHAGAMSVTSVTRKVFFTSQIIFLVLNFSTVWSVGCWLMLTTQLWNRNWVYSSITPMLVTLCWCQHHIVNQPLGYNYNVVHRRLVVHVACAIWACVSNQC